MRFSLARSEIFRNGQKFLILLLKTFSGSIMKPYFWRGRGQFLTSIRGTLNFQLHFMAGKSSNFGLNFLGLLYTPNVIIWDYVIFLIQIHQYLGYPSTRVCPSVTESTRVWKPSKSKYFSKQSTTIIKMKIMLTWFITFNVYVYKNTSIGIKNKQVTNFNFKCKRFTYKKAS